jgi:tripartite-type tricarboxylate transporter receptor subunit TctC
VKLARRNFLNVAAAATTLSALPRFVWALDYPTRPVRIVVGFAAGINPDIIARLFGRALSERLGQQFIIDDRPGASSNIGTEVVVRAPPDGYTLLAVTSTNAVNAALYSDLSFNFIRDIAPVAGTVRLPDILAVTPSFPVKTILELIDYTKANPGKVTVASNGSGSTSHIMSELFKSMAGIDMLHVPYRGSYVPDLLAGQVQVVFSPTAQSLPFIRAGRLRALAVTSAKRSPALPEIPAVAEYVPGYEAYVWDGIGAPLNTPAEIIDTLNKAINISLADDAMKARLADLGAEPMAMTPAEFRKFIANETEKWAKVIKFADIRAERTSHVP